MGNGKCPHRLAIMVRGGTLYPEQKVMPFNAAWCPEKDCGAFREESTTKDPRHWRYPGGKVEPADFTLIPPGEEAE